MKPRTGARMAATLELALAELDASPEEADRFRAALAAKQPSPSSAPADEPEPPAPTATGAGEDGRS